MFFRQLFDPDLAQYAYLVGCQRTGEAIVIDPQRDIDRYIGVAEEEGLRITAVTETHIHADFLSGAVEFGARGGVKLYLSDAGPDDWKYAWARESSYDVVYLQDGDTFKVGNIELRAIHTPGHTPEHISFLVTDLGGGASEPIGIASGDFVFVGDLGRPDLLESAAGQEGAREPAAHQLYDSTQRFLELSDHVQVWPGHGAGSACGKALGSVPQSTVGYERRFNAGLSFGRDEAGFVNAILDGQPEPPIYFARMKTMNRGGIPVLHRLPVPEQLDGETLTRRGSETGAVILDTREDRAAFMAGHIPGSLFAPLGINFAMVVGSYVDPSDEIYLVADADQVERAVRTLVRIGYDKVVGFTPPDTITASNQADATIHRVDFSDLEADPDTSARTLLDVRGSAEYSASHIPGAVQIAHTRLATRLDEIPTDRPVWVHCRSGNRASYAAALLQKHGYDVTFVDGAYADWPGLSTPVAP